jgi:hypothetical protein
MTDIIFAAQWVVRLGRISEYATVLDTDRYVLSVCSCIFGVLPLFRRERADIIFATSKCSLVVNTLFWIFLLCIITMHLGSD